MGIVVATSLAASGAGIMMSLSPRRAPRTETVEPQEIETKAPSPRVPPFRPSVFIRFDRGTRPLVTDANGDGTADVVVRAQVGSVHTVLAFDGKTGAELWRAKPKASAFTSFMTQVGSSLLVASDITVEAFDLPSGKPGFVATLDDKLRRVCRSAGSGARFLLAGNDVAVVDVGSGKITREKQGAACEDGRVDRSLADDVERRHFPVEYLPPELRALRCGGINVQGTYNYFFPDPCGPALRMGEAALSDLEADAVIPFDGGHLLIGRKRKARKAPMVGFAKQGAIVWQSVVSTDEPQDLIQASPDAAAFDGERVAIGAPMKSGPHLVVFDARTGSRVVDATLPEEASTVTAAANGAWIVVGSSKVVTVRADGTVATLLEGS